MQIKGRGAAKFRSASQVCISYAFPGAGVHAEVAAAFARSTRRSLKGQRRPGQKSTTMGPLANPRQLTTVIADRDAINERQVLAGGARASR